MAEATYAGKLGALVRFVAALFANAAELPHLEGARLRIEKILAEAQEVAREQAALTARKQEMSQRIRTLLTDGDRLMDAVGKFLKEHYGLRSEKLAEFGLQPFRGRSRNGKRIGSRSQEPPQTPPTTPAVPAIDPK